MKKSVLAITVLVNLFLQSCSDNPSPVAASTSSDSTAAIQPARKEIMLPTHTDDGTAYFSYIVKKGDSLVNQITSEKPVAFQGSKNIIIQLDSSHHLLVNGSGLNIYLNDKKDGKYPIASGTGMQEASILGSWLEKDETRTSYSVKKGIVDITRLVNDSCNGKFEGSFNLNGSDYDVFGEFQNVKVN